MGLNGAVRWLEIGGDVLEVAGLTRGDQHELIRVWIDAGTPTGDAADGR